MHRVLKKEQILTIPNLLSLLRLLMIPLIIWLYCGAEQYPAAVAVIVLSGLTDVADGIIARKCNMVSDFGKILDPIADKLTQGAVLICLAVKYKLMIPLIIEFGLCEIGKLAMGYVTIKNQDSVNSAKWYGKLTTVVLYAVMILLILFPQISDGIANGMIIGCGVMLLFSIVMYVRFYLRFWREARND